MMYLITIALLLGYALFLLYGLGHLAQELIAKPHPPPLLYSDPQTDQDGESRGGQQSPSAAQNASCALDVLRH
jgi:hypothetical protein